ncbi:MAG: DUF5713 family protein [Flavobacteriales bacterium]
MRNIRFSLLAITMVLCACAPGGSSQPTHMVQETLKNEAARNHTFLADMYADAYFPDQVVDHGKAILVRLCHRIEEQHPADLDALYSLTHSATNEFNDLQAEFEANDSELETGARESIGMDFAFIAEAYGYKADVEELIATREW